MLRSAIVATTVAAPDGTPLSELLVGETFEVLELSGGHAWGVAAVDGSVGRVTVAALAPGTSATHIVCVPAAPRDGGNALPMGARIAGIETDGWLDTDHGRIASEHVRPLGAPVADFVALAQSLIGAPAKPGGRSGAGLDSGGLVFLALSLAGIPAPRFVDRQAATLGHVVAATAPMLRGDLIFTEDDVAIAIDDKTAIHVAVSGVSTINVVDLGSVSTRRRLP